MLCSASYSFRYIVTFLKLSIIKPIHNISPIGLCYNIREFENPKDLMESTGTEFFTKFEQYAKFKIPSPLKRVLILCSYDRVASLSGFDEKSVAEIEEFVRNIFNKDMIPANESIDDYLGIFSKIQTKYVIMSGEKNLLEKASQICAMVYRDQNEDIISDVPSGTHPENLDGASITIPNQRPMLPATISTSDLFDTLKKWISEQRSLFVVIQCQRIFHFFLKQKILDSRTRITI